MNMGNVGQGPIVQELYASKGTVGGDFGHVCGAVVVGASARVARRASGVGAGRSSSCLHSSTEHGRITFSSIIEGL